MVFIFNLLNKKSEDKFLNNYLCKKMYKNLIIFNYEKLDFNIYNYFYFK